MYRSFLLFIGVLAMAGILPAQNPINEAKGAYETITFARFSRSWLSGRSAP